MQKLTLQNKIQFKYRRIDNEIKSIIHNQTDTAENGKTSLEDAQKAIMHLFSQIKDIKQKAEKSEEMVIANFALLRWFNQ